jgi:hypothetical protein
VIGVVLVMAGIGWYLVRRGLDVSDKLSSVGSLFTSLAGLVLSAVSVAQGRRSALPPAERDGTVPQHTPGVGGRDDLSADLEHLRAVTAVDHTRLFGVDQQLDTLGESLRAADSGWIISIFGGAGVGKTALAYELVKRHAADAGFQRVAAVSAKFSHIDRVGHIELDAGRALADWQDLLVDIARQLAPRKRFNTDLIERQLPAALPDEPCLIVIDNLETQEAELAVRYMASSGLTQPHKVVLTTRESVHGTGVYGLRELAWDGPDWVMAIEYARYLAADDALLQPTRQDLNDVVRAAERTPLLIQIIISQAREARLSIREVIARLRDVDGTLGSAVWAYCYVQSLNVLAERLGDMDLVAGMMSVFCLRPAGASVGSDEFFQLSGIADRERFHQARAMACKLALVKSLDGNTRFSVHSLLREFYCAQRSP